MKRFAGMLVLSLALAAGSAQGATTTIGQLSPAYSSIGNGCGGCAWFQTSVSAGPAYAAPRGGTITEFRMRIGSTVGATENVTPVVVRDLGGSMYRVVARLATADLSGSVPGSIATIPADVEVAQGDMIGIEYFTTNVAGGWPSEVRDNFNSADAQLSGSDDAMVGGDFTPAGTISSTRLNLEATLSYPDDPPPPPVLDTFAPLITQFKTAYKRFRYARKGAVVAKRAHPGTTISLISSEPGTVKFDVYKVFRGKITKGVCKKAGRSNRKGRRCNKYIYVHSFTRTMGTGVNRYPYSARYYDAKGKIGTLRKGPYRMWATPTDQAGNVGTPELLAFTITR